MSQLAERFPPGPIREASNAGAIFYADPNALTPEMIDPLIWPAVQRINASGWVWTAESCQGHPDAERPGPWTHNTRPMLRLVSRRGDHGRMLETLLRACFINEAVPGLPIDPERFGGGVLGLELWAREMRDLAWAESLVYIGARTAYERDYGCLIFERFGALLAIGSK